MTPNPLPSLPPLLSLLSLVFLPLILHPLLTQAENLKAEFPQDVLLPLKGCPRGFDFIGKTCGRVREIDATQECERRGSRLRDGMCESAEMENGAIMCSSADFELVDKDCVKREETSPEAECPHTYSFNGEICVRLRETFPSNKCEEGFRSTLDGICYKISKTNADRVCPQGFIPDKHSKCVTYEEAAPVHTCKARGFNLEDDKCVSVSVFGPTLTCREDQGFRYHPKDGCVRVDVHHPTLLCQEGELIGSRCKKVKTANLETRCRHGWTFHNNKCVKVLEEEPIVECTNGFSRHNDSCLHESWFPADQLCQKGFELKFGRCEVKQVQEPEEECSEGYELQEGECVERIERTPDETCPRGFHMSDKGCKKIVYHPSKLVCSGNEKELRGRYCVNYETTAAVKFCRSGRLSEDKERCVEVLEEQARQVCRRPFRLVDGKCVKTSYEEPEVLCSKGGEATRSGMCEKRYLTEPVRFCGRGYAREGDKCKKVEEADLIWSCKKGYKMVHRMCIPVSAHKPLLGSKESGLFVKKGLRS